MQTNFITLTDSYKFGHWQQMPNGLQRVYSYAEARTGAKFPYMLFYGLQSILLKYFSGPVITREKIEWAEKLSAAHFGNPNIFNRAMWEYILEKYNGYLPLRIKAVPEGLKIPINNALMVVENTDDKCSALTNHSETILSHVWYPSTVATLSAIVKENIKKFLVETSDSLDGLDYMLHDFGFRGVSSVESAGAGGSANLISFKGTDTLQAIEFAMKYYNADVCGVSVPATEHSVMTALGPDGEEKIITKLLKSYPTGVLSVVSDSYDIFKLCEVVLGEKLRDQIIQREGVFVVRPDSGDPIYTVLKVLDILGEKMGKSLNSKNFYQLHPSVKVLWGDGLDKDKIVDILLAMRGRGWSASNIATFGMGGGLLQKVNRDTQRFAFKCCAQKRDGIWYDIFKDPLDRSKASKRGKLKLVQNENGEYQTIADTPENSDKKDIMEVVYENGIMVKEYTFDEVRQNAQR